MLKLNLQYFAEEPEIVDEPEKVEKPEKKEEPKKPETKTFTQEELDDILAKRLERERKKFGDYDEIKSKLSEYEKSKMTEQERLQAEKEEAENRAKESEERANQALTKANERLLKAEFRLLAKELGVRNEALDDAFVLADLSNAEVDDDGTVKGVKEALDTLKEKKAYLFSAKNYADPSPGNPEPKRDTKESMKKKLDELAEKAKKSGRIEDKIEYSRMKKELGL